MIGNRSEAVRYLDSLIGSGIRPGLDRMKQLLEVAGEPHRSVPAILVAGTNGKGSTAATLSGIVHAAGYRVGLYTSPHLVELEERWRIGEEPVEEPEFIAAVRRLHSTARGADFAPTYFEALTLLAFFIFERSSCELAILEVGMGGRLDATNVVDPLLSVITRIDYDHQEWLGNTIEEIAGEKLGIARPGAPLVVAHQPEEVTSLMRRWCGEHQCPIHVVPEEVLVDAFSSRLEGSSMELTTPVGSYRLRSPLVGAHQIANLSAAVRAAEVLSETFSGISEVAITDGVAGTRWRGRLESFNVGERLVIVDGAHNPAGTASAAAFVRTLPGPRALVFGALSDKDAASMLRPFAGLFDHVILTAPDSDRAMEPDSLVPLVKDGEVTVNRNDEGAIRTALEIPGISTIAICGSLYLAGTAIRLLDTMAMPNT